MTGSANGDPSDPVGTDRLAELLLAARSTVFFTGAGVSTESGIPDFRSPGGLWTRYDPTELAFDKYVASPEVRRLSWEMRRAFFAVGARPNPAHHAIAALQGADRSPGVITQNIDGLHQAAGSATVVELHGTARRVACIGVAPTGGVPAGCGWTADTQWVFDRIDAGEDDPHCPNCGGLVKSATISFGQMMNRSSLQRAEELLAVADAVVVVGSSLVVHPAAALPELAASRGIPCAIVNRTPTALDDQATVVVHADAGAALPPAVDAVLRAAGRPR